MNKSITTSGKRQAKKIVAFVKLLQALKDFDYNELESYVEKSIHIAILDERLEQLNKDTRPTTIEMAIDHVEGEVLAQQIADAKEMEEYEN